MTFRSQGESLTLQLGNYSNMVCAHLWNVRQAVFESGDESEDVRTDLHYHSSASGQLVPRCVVSDLYSNLGSLYSVDIATIEQGTLWNEKSQKIVVNSGRSECVGGVAGSSTCSSSIEAFWSDILEIRLEARSICELPKWSHEGNFNHFYKGVAGNPLCDALGSAYIDDFMERIRFFAEGCEHLSTIEVFADLQDGFGGLAWSLLEEIREDYGSSISIPVWGFPDPRQSKTAAVYGPGSLGDNVSELSLPLAYSNIVGLVNMMIPIDVTDAMVGVRNPQKRGPNRSLTKNEDDILSSRTIASVVDAATGFYIEPGFDLSLEKAMDAKKYGTTFMGEIGVVASHFSMSDLSYLATGGGHWPICSAEAWISNMERGAVRSFDEEVVASFEKCQYSSVDQRTRNSGASSSTPSESPSIAPLKTLNPFCTSFSAATSGKWKAQRAKADIENKFGILSRYPKPNANVLSVRGSASVSIFSKCSHVANDFTRDGSGGSDSGSSLKGYTLTSFQQRSTPLYLPPNTFLVQNKGNQRTDESTSQKPTSTKSDNWTEQQRSITGTSEDTAKVCSAAAIGSNRYVGDHILRVLESWKRHATVCKAQLEKVGVDSSDASEITENLTNIFLRYIDD